MWGGWDNDEQMRRIRTKRPFIHYFFLSMKSRLFLADNPYLDFFINQSLSLLSNTFSSYFINLCRYTIWKKNSTGAWSFCSLAHAREERRESLRRPFLKKGIRSLISPLVSHGLAQSVQSLIRFKPRWIWTQKGPNRNSSSNPIRVEAKVCNTC